MRRSDFLGVGAAAAATTLSARAADAAGGSPPKRPNIVIYHADEFRWDFVGHYGLNPGTNTPHLDALARSGVAFASAMTNNPLCSPSRACLLASQYSTQLDVWDLGPGLDPKFATIARVARANGYTANYIGKWHLAPNVDEGMDKGIGLGAVPARYRGGFDDVWEAANVLEMVSHPYAGTIWDRDGKPISWSDTYRVDFMTQRVLRFIDAQTRSQPFLLMISQLEPHFQNDLGRPVAPKGYAQRYRNPFVPQDLRLLPGVWHEQLPDYYGCVESIDDSVGTVRAALRSRGLEDDTIFVFLSDHGCHFQTRSIDYKRTIHDASIRVPFIVSGPGFAGGHSVNDIVTMIDIAPTILKAAGLPIPSEMLGRDVSPLLHDPKARGSWKQEAFVQMSEVMTGRGIRTERWAFCMANPNGESVKFSDRYQDYQLFDMHADPHQIVNLAGRRERTYRDACDELRELVTAWMASIDEPAATFERRHLYPT